jgi:hypothetical protein
MIKHLAVLAALAFAAPALAGEAVPLSDDQLDRVSGGTGSVALPTTNINVNASPIILTQTAVALNLQSQTGSFRANGKGKGKALGLAKQSQSQFGFAAASNTAKINYHVVQINAGG